MLEIGFAAECLVMLIVVTRRISFVRVPLGLTWHSIKAYDLALRQPWIKLHGFAAGLPMVRASTYDNRNHQQDTSFHNSLRIRPDPKGSNSGIQRAARFGQPRRIKTRAAVSRCAIESKFHFVA